MGYQISSTSPFIIFLSFSRTKAKSLSLFFSLTHTVTQSSEALFPVSDKPTHSRRKDTLQRSVRGGKGNKDEQRIVRFNFSIFFLKIVSVPSSLGFLVYYLYL